MERETHFPTALDREKPPAAVASRDIPEHVSFGRPKYRGPSTYVRGLKHCARPGGTRGCNTWPDCERKLAGVHGSRGGRKAAEKIFCCVTTRGLKIGVGSRLRRGLGSLTAHAFGGGVLGFDLFVLAAFGLTTGGLPAADLLAAFDILAIPLVPAAWSELPSAAEAETSSDTWSALSSGTPLV